jgi:type II secretory pathway component PulF
MTATSQSIGQPSNSNFDFLPQEFRTLTRRLVGWIVAWWFFAKILPIFETVHLALGLAVSSLGSCLVAISDFSTSAGKWLIPVCLVVDCAIALAAEGKDSRHWQRRWTRAVEVFLFATVVLAMLVFLTPLLVIWITAR